MVNFQILKNPGSQHWSCLIPAVFRCTWSNRAQVQDYTMIYQISINLFIMIKLKGYLPLKKLGLNLRLLNQVLHSRVVTFEEKTCTRATLEFDSREVPGYPRFTLCSLKWGHDLPSEFQGGYVCSVFSVSGKLKAGINAAKSHTSDLKHQLFDGKKTCWVFVSSLQVSEVSLPSHSHSSSPRIVTRPWICVSEKLGRRPMLDYAGCVLNNWERIDPERPLKPSNLRLLRRFTGLVDEESW